MSQGEQKQQGEQILPILDRATPVLDAIRNGSEKGGGEQEQFRVIRATVSHAVAEEEQREQFLEGAQQRIRESIAEEAGVPEQSISDELVEEFTEVIQKEREDIVDGDKDSEEDGKEEESPEF